MVSLSLLCLFIYIMIIGEAIYYVFPFEIVHTSLVLRPGFILHILKEFSFQGSIIVMLYCVIVNGYCSP